MAYSWEKNDEYKREVTRTYKVLLNKSKSWKQRSRIRKAFDIAAEAHAPTVRKSGEPYILHPLAVARILVEEMGLDDPDTIICALLHDTVEDTDITLENIEYHFGPQCRYIIDGLTKVKGATILEEQISAQAENFRRILLTISNDIRVILVKIADRLHNMRTLGSMKEEKKQKIAAETLYLYAPVANRIGLYHIKSELEDLAFFHSQPVVYAEINEKLEDYKKVEAGSIKDFVKDIQKLTKKLEDRTEIESRFKTVASIHNKMVRQQVPFEKVYDLFAVRIIIKVRKAKRSEDPVLLEQKACWGVFTAITQKYSPNPIRTRDWISFPKENGYEGLHVTVKGPGKRWVEVQIRSERMHREAERGMAAHWKYKDGDESFEEPLATWIHEVRETLVDPELSAFDAVKQFREGLQPKNVYVFTPKGELTRLPKNATVIDFAFKIHSQIGTNAIGGKVNNKIVTLDHILNPGDHVEVITSEEPQVAENWLAFATTSRAQDYIRRTLRAERQRHLEQGKEIFLHRAEKLGVDLEHPYVRELLAYLMYPTLEDLWVDLSRKKVDVSQIAEFIQLKREGKELSESVVEHWEEKLKQREERFKAFGVDPDALVLPEGINIKRTELARCCEPVSGVGIIGMLRNDVMEIHRTSCPTAMRLMANFGGNIVRVQWAEGQGDFDFLASIKVVGFDKQGMLAELIDIITNKANLNISKVQIETQGRMFEGIFSVFVNSDTGLDNLVERLEAITNVMQVTRARRDNKPFHKS
ncbi:MAG: bifunctional (p)ppGpp synthetase/guanosine-3',5'-bis(diphosphate) 3'-pyrophosphohydrolase [Bacteroidia bacterium]